MTVFKPSETNLIFLTWTTEPQLVLIKKELEQRLCEVSVLWCEAQEQADCTDQIDNDLDALHSALENFLSDLT